MKHLEVVRPVDVTLQPHGVAVIESHHARGFDPARMCHSFAKFLFILDGAGSMAADRSYALKSGVLVHVAPGIAHTIEDRESPLALYAACYAPERLAPALASTLTGSGVRQWVLADQSPHMLACMRSDLRDLLHEQRTRAPGWEAQQQATITRMIVRAVRLDDRMCVRPSSHADGSSIDRVRVYLESRGDRLLLDTLDTAAEACGISRRRFTELFRSLTGETFRQYVYARRIDHAKRLLTETDLPIAGVAFEAGMDDLSHFHRTFRATTGQTPREYRATYLGS